MRMRVNVNKKKAGLLFQPVKYRLGPFPRQEKREGEQAFFLSFFFRA